MKVTFDLIEWRKKSVVVTTSSPLTKSVHTIKTFLKLLFVNALATGVFILGFHRPMASLECFPCEQRVLIIIISRACTFESS